MRKIVAAFLLVLLAAGSACCEAPFAVSAKGAILMEAGSGRVLFAQNADQMLPMASTTKTMTLLLALENAKPDEKVTASARAAGTGGTSIYLSEGETLTMEQMLYGLMLRSGNDAAVAIAEHVGGTEADFVEMMNARAEKMGIDAHFSNPHGLDADGHRASARAMASILREGLKNEEYARITSTKNKTIPWPGNEYSRSLTNKNRLLTSYEGAQGGKTGYTSKAGRCLVFSAERDGMLLVGAVLNCSTWFDTAETLLNYGFEQYSLARICQKGEALQRQLVAGGQRDYVNLVAEDGLAVPLTAGEHYELAYDTADEVHAPVKKGDSAGTLTVYVNGAVLGKTRLLYADDVPQNNMENALEHILDQWLVDND